MLDTRGTKQCITRSNFSYFVRNAIPGGTGGHEIDFIAIVGNLRTIGRSRREPEFEVTVGKYFGRSSRRAW